MQSLLEFSPKELQSALLDLGQAPYRAKQILPWLVSYTKIQDMTNLSKAFRQMLADHFEEGYLTVKTVRESSDGTKKYLLQLADGNLIEAVIMQHRYGVTACISTQVGCQMNCAFCASCKNGLVRNLTAGELVSQVLCLNHCLGKGRCIENIVLMGSGEPLQNYENVVSFLKRIHAADCLGISYRNISLSTCGIVPGILQLAEEEIPLTLCLSLHAPTDEKRRKIMPIAKKYSLAEIKEALLQYQKASGRRIIFEYLLLPGLNDTLEDIDAIKNLARGMLCHVNLIRYNPIREECFRSASKKEMYRFLNQLQDAGVSATVRRSLGSDIDGACGQLRAKYMEQPK